MSTIKLFETQEVRSHRDADKEAWFFGIVNVVAVPTSSADAGAYGRKLKQRLNPRLSISPKTAIVSSPGKPRGLGISNGYH